MRWMWVLVVLVPVVGTGVLVLSDKDMAALDDLEKNMIGSFQVSSLSTTMASRIA